MMDVVSRKCQVEGCLKRPWYSYDGARSVLCAEHKTPGMVGYRPPQKDVMLGAGTGAAAGRGGGAVGIVDVVGGGGGRKRTYADMSIGHHQHHNAGNGGAPSDLVPAGLDSVGLAGMDMGEDGLQGASGLGLDGMGGDDHLGPARMEVGVTGLESGGGLDGAGIGEAGLDPTGMGSADHHLGHGPLEQRGLETPGLDAGGEHHQGHHHHDDHEPMVLQPVLPAHVAHPGSIVGPSDKMFH